MSGIASFAAATSAAMAGMTSTTVLYPLDIIKTRMQSSQGGKPLSIKETLDEIMKEGGIAAVFKGLELKIGGSAVEKFTYFYVFSLLGGGTFDSTLTELLAGYISELSSKPVSIPLECVANRVQAHPTPISMANMLGLITKEQGVAALYQGLGGYFVESIQPAIHFGLFEMFKKRTGKPTLGFAESFVYGAVARALSTLLIYPVKRARVMCQTTGKGLGLVSVLVRELSLGGPARLFKGIEPELIRGVLSTALMLALKERITAFNTRNITLVYALLFGGPAMLKAPTSAEQ